MAGGRAISLFLCGDVMTGRGIDQVLPHPSDPMLHERYVEDARVYVELAERAHGPIERPASAECLWGDALAVLSRRPPDARIVNLETSVTRSDDYWPAKGIHYRMHPDNVGCLAALGIDCCVLANNHVLDWGYAGLEETLAALHAAGLGTAGAGRDAAEASAPLVLEPRPEQRVLVFACGSETSGIPPAWRARARKPGIHLLDALSRGAARRLASAIESRRRPGDVVVLSVHWGENWGYAIPDEQREFAHELVDRGAVDVLHGHSSHHAKGIEVYRNKPILYGCGDFLNDYEGILDARDERYASHLALMYLVELGVGGAGGLERLDIVPMRIERFGLRSASKSDARWLAGMLTREGEALGTRAELAADTLTLRWGLPATRTGTATGVRPRPGR